ncbi:unnamed protein product [Symbiodinium microadriaticum]|nr:unnamed protein product [Symbiodinium microadriaticum]
MMGFRDGFCEKASLRWQEVHPGRLLHVRCFSKKQHLDLVCVYQHALPFDAGALKMTLAKRKQLWNKLDSLLQSFPVRSSVVVAGDFNSNLCSSGSSIGHSVLHNAAKSTVVEERQWLSGLLASHQLTALNSWSRKLPTYWHPSGSSQIDWILVRSSLADSRAKKCTPSDAPVAGWRSAGHKVLKASIPLNWMPWKISGSRTEKALFSSRHEAPDASPLQRVIQEVSGSEVPARQIPARPGFVGVDGEVLQFWQVRKLLSQHRIASLRDVFVRMLRDEQGLLLHPKDECKLLADYAEVAEKLSQVAIDALCCSDPKVPIEWSTVQLAWLAKAGKTPSRPQNLRSIGLMSVDSKAFLIVLRSALAPYVEQAMHDHPQYAYRKGASTADALMRAAGHCSTVRLLLQRHRHDQTSRLLGEAVVPCVGGLMCGLDLQKAFDALPHSELHDAMIEAGVPEPLAATITQVHVQTRCAIKHGGTEREVCMSRGLRQGCPIAPLLYAAWSCRFCKLLDKRLSASWTSSHCTLFADDIFSSWVIRSVKEFHAAVRELRALIEALRLLGMSVNFQKSVVVLRLCGKAVERLSKSYLVWRSGVQHLRVRCTDNDIYIPCATQMPYLGAELSYDNFELKTFKGREKQATARFQELRRVLRTNGSITVRHRLRIYKAIVWPTLWYALSSVGITTEVLRGVCSVLAGHLRKVLRVYQEGVSNKMILQQAGLDPREFFLGQVQKKGLCIQRDPRRAEHVKAPESRHCRHLHQRLLGLEDNPNMTSLVRIPKVDAVAVVCPCCGITYDSQASLQMHIKHQHSEVNQSARLAFHRDLHALHGLPICRFCQARLHDWRSLEKHITEGTCPKVKVFVSQGLDADAMLRRVREDEQLHAPPVPQKATPQSQLEQDIGEALKFEPSTLNSCGAKLLILATRCALRRQLIPDSSKIKIHWQRTHAPEWKKYSATAISGAKSLCSVFSTPCRFCGSQAKNSRDHSAKCSSLFQLLAVRAMRSAGSTAPMPAKGPAPKQSERSPLYAQFDITKTGLGKYLRKAGDQEAGSDAQKALFEEAVTLYYRRSSLFDPYSGPGPSIADNMTKGFKFSTPEVHQFRCGCGRLRVGSRFELLLNIMETVWCLVTIARSLNLPLVGCTLMTGSCPLRFCGPKRVNSICILSGWYRLNLSRAGQAWTSCPPSCSAPSSFSGAMGSDEPMKSIEGSEEWNFYQQYRPAGFQLASGPPSEVSTAATAEEREAKTAKLEKGGRGKGSQGTPGSSGDGAGQSNKRQGQWGNGGGGRQNWGWQGNWKDSGSSGDGAELQEIQKLLTMMQKLAPEMPGEWRAFHKPTQLGKLVNVTRGAFKGLDARLQLCPEAHEKRCAHRSTQLLRLLRLHFAPSIRRHIQHVHHTGRNIQLHVGHEAILQALSYNAVLQLVATQLKEDRVSRSTLANNIAASIKG